MFPFMALTFWLYNHVNGFNLDGISWGDAVALPLLSLCLIIVHELIHGITWACIYRLPAFRCHFLNPAVRVRSPQREAYHSGIRQQDRELFHQGREPGVGTARLPADFGGLSQCGHVHRLGWRRIPQWDPAAGKSSRTA